MTLALSGVLSLMTLALSGVLSLMTLASSGVLPMAATVVGLGAFFGDFDGPAPDVPLLRRFPVGLTPSITVITLLAGLLGSFFCESREGGVTITDRMELPFITTFLLSPSRPFGMV